MKITQGMTTLAFLTMAWLGGCGGDPPPPAPTGTEANKSDSIGFRFTCPDGSTKCSGTQASQFQPGSGCIMSQDTCTVGGAPPPRTIGGFKFTCPDGSEKCWDGSQAAQFQPGSGCIGPGDPC
jgi:hypothetical protein